MVTTFTTFTTFTIFARAVRPALAALAIVSADPFIGLGAVGAVPLEERAEDARRESRSEGAPAAHA